MNAPSSPPARPPVGPLVPATPARVAIPRWLLLGTTALGLFGLWGALYKTLPLTAPQAQALSTLGELPIIVLLFARLRREARPLSARGPVAAAFLAGLLTALGNLCMYTALSRGGATAAVVPLTNLYPLVTVLLAPLVLRERPGAVPLVGVGVALVAIYLFSGAQVPGTGLALSPYALAPIALWGVAALLQKLSTRTLSAEAGTLLFLLAFLPLAGLLVAVEPMRWDLDAAEWACVLALGASSAFGNLALIAAFRAGGPASVVTPLVGLYPAVTVPLAVLGLGEVVDPRTWAGIGLSLVAVLALTFEAKGKA